MKLTLLAVIGRLHPEIYDVPPKYGPLRTRGDLASLNPQPLPPRSAYAEAAVELAGTLVRMAAEAETHGNSGAGFVSEFIDEWCGTPWPRRWPFPVPFPGPEPGPYDVMAGRISAALAFASAGSRIQDERLGGALTDGAERLAEAALADFQVARGVPAQAIG